MCHRSLISLESAVNQKNSISPKDELDASIDRFTFQTPAVLSLALDNVGRLL
jgi:hypothetical protein